MSEQKFTVIFQGEKRDEMLSVLIKAGAIPRDEPRTLEDSYYSSSIGKKGEKTLEVKI